MPPSYDSGTALNPCAWFRWVFKRRVEGKEPRKQTSWFTLRQGRNLRKAVWITESHCITLLLNLLTKEDPWCTPFRAHKISTRYDCFFHMTASFRYRKYVKPSSTSVKKTMVVNQNQSSSKASSGMPCLKDSWKGRMMESRMTKNMTKKSHVILPVQFGFKMPWLKRQCTDAIAVENSPSSNQCWWQFGHHWRKRPSPNLSTTGPCYKYKRSLVINHPSNNQQKIFRHTATPPSICFRISYPNLSQWHRAAC